jgi:Tetrapyrrole (Corrin/Porphyrin) Methylases
MTTDSKAQSVGTVYLVGAGPGDPELITVRGQRILQQAEVVVYDRLVPPQLLRQTLPQAELIYAGKSPGHHVLRQAQINALLIDRARKGNLVVRLKGGDPSVFGRAGEEMAAPGGDPLCHRPWRDFRCGRRGRCRCVLDPTWCLVSGCPRHRDGGRRWRSAWVRDEVECPRRHRWNSRVLHGRQAVGDDHC